MAVDAAPVSAGTLSLFAADELPTAMAVPLVDLAAQEAASAPDDDEVVYPLAEIIIRETGQHSCYLRNITRQGLYDWERSGAEVRPIGPHIQP